MDKHKLTYILGALALFFASNSLAGALIPATGQVSLGGFAGVYPSLQDAVFAEANVFCVSNPTNYRNCAVVINTDSGLTVNYTISGEVRLVIDGAYQWRDKGTVTLTRNYSSTYQCLDSAYPILNGANCESEGPIICDDGYYGDDSLTSECDRPTPEKPSECLSFNQPPEWPSCDTDFEFAELCTTAGTSTYCIENVNEKCPDGVCEAGCGYINNNAQAGDLTKTFICFDSDTTDSTITNEDGSVTTITTNNNGTVTSTTTNNDGSVTTTITNVEGESESTTEKEEKEGTYADANYLYTPEYPDGFSGVMTDRIAQFKGGEFYKSMQNFIVTLSPMGVPPLQICTETYGCFNLDVPSWIWDFIKAVIILTAGFVCRRIIFGG